MSQTAEHLTLASLGKSPLEPKPGDGESGDRGNSVFKEDESLPVQFRAKLQDYFRSGYDRGHMCVLESRRDWSFSCLLADRTLCTQGTSCRWKAFTGHKILPRAF